MKRNRLLTRLGLGRAAYHLWHRPAAALRQSAAVGGPWQQWRNHRGRRAMERAAERLPPSTAAAAADGLPDLHFLTGRKFWYQTAFCLHSLETCAGRRFRAHFHDDGTLSAAVAARLTRRFPQAVIHSHAETAERLARAFPTARYPSLEALRRRPYTNLLKFTAVHAGRSGWQLVLDSDMLFFRRPDLLLSWMAAPNGPITMTDVETSYGYPTSVLTELAGAPVPDRVNVGVFGLDSGAIDWDRIEAWTKELQARHGTSYFLDQALAAMLLAQGPATALPAAEYVVMPDIAQCRDPREILQHYVAGSKRGYFRHAWHHALL